MTTLPDTPILRAILMQIIKEYPGASEARVQELFLVAVRNNEQAAHEAAKFFVSGELRKLVCDAFDVARARVLHRVGARAQPIQLAFP
jgi:hypothetical protein